MTTVASADIHALAEALKRSGKEAHATTYDVLIRSANFLLTEMQVRVPVDTGRLRESLGVRVESDRVIIGPDTPYAGYVEFGTKPHEIRSKGGKPLGVHGGWTEGVRSGCTPPRYQGAALRGGLVRCLGEECGA